MLLFSKLGVKVERISADEFTDLRLCCENCGEWDFQGKLSPFLFRFLTKPGTSFVQAADYGSVSTKSTSVLPVPYEHE
jgi:hypothetical protein